MTFPTCFSTIHGWKFLPFRDLDILQIKRWEMHIHVSTLSHGHSTFLQWHLFYATFCCSVHLGITVYLTNVMCNGMMNNNYSGSFYTLFSPHIAYYFCLKKTLIILQVSIHSPKLKVYRESDKMCHYHGTGTQHKILIKSKYLSHAHHI